MSGAQRGMIVTLVLVCSVVAAGCGGSEVSGPPIGAVAGKVKLAGRPVSSGEILMVSDDGFAASAPLQSDGSFQLVSQYGKGIPQGTYRVAIMPKPAEQVPGKALPAADAPDTSEIPPKYRDPATSGFTAQVEDKNSEYTFDMQPE